MKLTRLFPLLLVAATFSNELRGIDMIQAPRNIRQYETARFRFAQTLGFSNPFDLDTNSVELRIEHAGLPARTLSFFYDGVDEEGNEQWEARFSPGKAGPYRLQVRIAGKAEQQLDLQVEPNPDVRQGGLKLSEQFGAFAYESGETFRGIGLNVCWAQDFEYYFKKMHAAGMNVTRIWMCPWSLSFEWKETGLGRYSLETARQLDSILQLADQSGIFVILCMDYHGVARKGLGYFNENRWKENPYNKLNGGPCPAAADLFTNPEAKRLLKKKYKYIVSRFGHSSRIAAWEFYNEADLMAGKSRAVNSWHVEMAEYVRSIDLHGRLVSTSSTRSYPEKLVDAFLSPAMDFAMFHDYNSLDIAPHFTDLIEATLEYYRKPVVIGEFGVEFRGAERTHRVDSQHVGLHNGIWAGWFSETPIVPMSWWWDNYIDPHDLWHEFTILSRFAGMLDLNTQQLRFRSLVPGSIAPDGAEPAPCMVRSITAGDNCALWLKHEEYQWSLISEKREPKWIGPFTQVVPDLSAGRYSARWYDPQTGAFSERSDETEADQRGELRLLVPAFSRDLACVITRVP